MVIDVLFVHSAGSQQGDEGSAPFVRYLRDALGDAFRLASPAMPSPDDPAYLAWQRELTKRLDSTPTPLLLVGHSLGASVLLKHLSEDDRPVAARGLFLVATPYWGQQDWDASQFALRDDFADFLPDTLAIHFYQSEDDDVVPMEHLARYAAQVPQATFTRVAQGGHVFREGLDVLVRDMQSVAAVVRRG